MTNESESESFDIWKICPMASIFTQNVSNIFSYSNFRCRYLHNQSDYPKKPDTLLLIDALGLRLYSHFASAAVSNTI